MAQVKPTQLPEFAEAIHYTELRGGRYRFKLLCDLAIKLPELRTHEGKISFRDKDGIEWARVDRDTYTIRKGYAWNGNSPSKWVPLIGWIGTPNFHSTRMASLFHDSFWQFCRTKGFPFSLEQTNSIFYDIMLSQGFPKSLAGLYHQAVKSIGLRWFISPTPVDGEYSVLLHY